MRAHTTGFVTAELCLAANTTEADFDDSDDDIDEDELDRLLALAEAE